MKSRILITLMIGLLHTSSALSQSLADYYRSADGLQKEQLKTALYKIISNHKQVAYKSLFDYYEQTDACINNPAQIYDMFSTNTYYFVSVGSSMNKEHVCPQSWWGGGSKYPIYSDLFNVYPSDAKANSHKSNYPLGKITGELKYDSGRIKVGKSSNSGGCGYVVEPYDEFKGDFARIYLYDATCYQNINWVSTAYAFPTGVNTYPTLESWIIPILLEWNRLDPPSEWEITRNNRVYTIQNNRNPFIDYPQLAEYIWGDSITYAWDLSKAIPNVIDGNTNIPSIDTDDPTDKPDNPSDNPTDNPTDDPDKPTDNPSTDDDPTVAPISGNLLFAESFDEIKAGNSTSNSGSSSPFNESDCDSISSATWCYSAGGAVRVGKSSAAGSISTTAIPATKGNTLSVAIEVKGWTEVEGDLEVSITGAEKKILTYSAKMSDKFERVEVTFENIPSDNPILTIATTSKRCFINSIRVYIEANETEDPSDNPDDSSEDTDEPTDEDDTPSVVPDNPTDNPNDSTEDTDNPTDNPDDSTEDTDNPTDNPDDSTEDTDNPTDNPDDSTEETDNPSDNPEDSTEDTDNPTDNPDDSTEDTDEPGNQEVAIVHLSSNNRTPIYYDLFGRRINGKPTKSGIYIVNGVKKYIK